MASPKKYKLHEAMQIVLSDQPNLTATTHVICSEIERRNLYRKRDGSRLMTEQIQARFNTHRDLFDRIAPSTFRLIGSIKKDNR